MDSSALYDEHTIYLRCGNVTKEQVVGAFMEACRCYSVKTCKQVECNVKVTLISQGIGYVYVTNPMVYQLLLGRYVDLSEQSESEEDNDEPITDWSGFPKIGNWADFVEQEEARERMGRQSAPLMTLPGFAANWELAPAKAEKVSYHEIPNVLKSVKMPVPEWVTEADIRNQFASVTSSSVNVNINKNRVAFVTFDPQSNDSYFALRLLGQMNIRKFGPNKIIRNTTLFFNHASYADLEPPKPSEKSRPVGRAQHSSFRSYRK